MRIIMALNPKGGCGKTTIATNLATYYANNNHSVVLVDYDRQKSSLEWLDARNEHNDLPPIHGIAGFAGPVRPPKDTDIMIMDGPAGIHGKELTDLLRRVETLIIPILPSPIDMRAAGHFIEDILHLGRVSKKKLRLAIVANRVKERTTIYHSLELFLGKVRIPFLTHFRDTQNYIHAAKMGLGIFELYPSTVIQDLEQWEPLHQWLRSRRSLPVQ